MFAGESLYSEKANKNGTCVIADKKSSSKCPMCALGVQVDGTDAPPSLSCAKEDGFKLPATDEEFDGPLMCGSGEEASLMESDRGISTNDSDDMDDDTNEGELQVNTETDGDATCECKCKAK